MKIGILGGGQLAKMLALSGIPLGFEFTVFSPEEESCAGHLGRRIRFDYTDEKALSSMSEWSDVITFEFENIPLSCINYLAVQGAVRPGPLALRLAQDRFLEKQLFTELEIPCTPFYKIDSLSELYDAAKLTGFPAILKTRRQGYDGKGQQVLRHIDDLEQTWKFFEGVPFVLERSVNFEREVSLIAVRGMSGDTVFYNISENIHKKGILHLAVSQPYDPLQGQAELYAKRLLEKLDYVGVLTLEFFQVGNSLIANEYAPRVHNSGHWTIEGADTSQFENHLRAISGLPLGSTALKGVAATINLIGSIPDKNEILRTNNTHLHLYGKTCRPGRKVGHITVCADNMNKLRGLLAGLSLEEVRDVSI
ncbi:MAG: 5-(carboxyamino)imidazole ribonucleotide synthase [Thermodesulfobacteriota bacterium]